MRLFLSSQAVDRSPARDLINALRAEGISVEHSPSNPLDRNDSRWADWYNSGLAAALHGCDVFVIVIDRGWDSSTWMAVEAEAGLANSPGKPARRVFFWNPEGIIVKAAGMIPYLQDELPHDLSEAIRQIAGNQGAHHANV